MKEIPKRDPENLPERVRRNTRPYVGVMDWYDTINANPFFEPVQYFGKIDIDEHFYPGILWRYRNEGECTSRNLGTPGTTAGNQPFI